MDDFARHGSTKHVPSETSSLQSGGYAIAAVAAAAGASIFIVQRRTFCD